MLTVFLNGRFVEPGQAGVPVMDAGLQHGVGLFETMVGFNASPGDGGGAQVPLLEEHLARLDGSAQALGLTDRLQTGPLAEAVIATLSRSGLPAARLRLTITGGDLSLLARGGPGGVGTGAGTGAGAGAGGPTVLIVAQPATAYPPAMLERGVRVGIADTRVSPLDAFAAHKTLNYWWRLRELQHAGARGAAEALVFTAGNHVVGGCVSSVLMVKGGSIIVPIARGEETGAGDGATDAGGGGQSMRGESMRGGAATLPSPVLPGVTRTWAIHSAEGLGVLTTRRMVTIHDVLGADELMLTNASWGVLPVTAVEAAAIGGGTVGPVTAGLLKAWAADMTRAGRATTA